MDERISKYFEGLLSREERIRLLEDIHTDPVLKRDLLEIQNLQGILHFSPHAIDTEEGIRAYTCFKRKKRVAVIKKNIQRGIAYAAAVTGIIFSTWIFSHIHYSKEGMVSEEIQMQELYVPPGQRARLTLPDGSVAWVNAGSTLKYPSRFGKERKIELTGEGYFQVAKDKAKPFIVSGGPLNIQALGTEFNVYAYPRAEYFSTSLVEGSIAIYTGTPGSSPYILSPSEQLYYENGEINIKPFDDTEKLLWKEGIYSFKKEPMEKIIKNWNCTLM
ncbi:MAG: FecR domain-containing protein [Tannerellaceae bacterium]|nr:FecR domain-containing protein [Tannerellaceae bacterium]